MPPATPFNSPDSGAVADNGSPRGSSKQSVNRSSALARDASNQYLKSQVETASPTRLVVLLYDGAIRFCHQALDAMRREDLEGQNASLIRAQRVVCELLSSLNRAAGGEVAANLTRIYTHILEELVKANLYDDQGPVVHAVQMLTEMRVSWLEIDGVDPTNSVAGRAEPTIQTNEAALANSPHQPGAVPTAAIRPNTRGARLLASTAANRQPAASRLGDTRA